MELSDFNIFNNISNDLKSIIKSFYVFSGDYCFRTALFVTIDDKVFGFGCNRYGVCGQACDREIKEPLIITELSDKGVKEFFNGFLFVLCPTSDNKLFSWGDNGLGSFEPRLILSLNYVKIIQVCCDSGHSLVLTEEGVVYGWGDNRFGQTGVGQRSDKFIASPKQWNNERKVIKIHCSGFQSFAITECGRVYCCGRIDHCQLGLPLEKDECVYNPTLLDIENVQNIITSETNTYFVTYESDIYFFENDNIDKNYQKTPLKILNLTNMQSFTSSNYIFNNKESIYWENSIYQLTLNKIKKTELETLGKCVFDSLGDKTLQTHKTVHIYQDDIKVDSKICEITEKYIPRYLRCKNNIEKFEISDNIPENIKQIVKYFHVPHEDYTGFLNYNNNILFVTIDDKVFGKGYNYQGVCGLGHESKVKEIELIPELCDKGVKQFFIGKGFALCLTSDNHLFSWGKNYYGQLGIGQLNKHKIFKPQLIDYFNNKTIVQVCCGDQYSAVLTSDNCVHLWGCYKKYINYKKSNETIIKSPMKYELKEEIKLIHCSELQTFCVTKCGKVYYLEVNSDKKMKAISSDLLKNIQGIGSSIDYTYFISDSTIYSINNNKSLFSEIITKLINKITIFELKFQSNLKLRSNYVLYNDNSVYEFGKKCRKSKYKNLFDYYCDKYEMTFETNVVENIKTDANNTTNYFIKKFVSQENDISNILKTFTITNKIGGLRSFINYFYIFFDKLGHNILFITNDENVYGFGFNFCGCCGLGHNNSVSEPQIIKELCNNNVIKFFHGICFSMALTNDNELYVWRVINEHFDSFSKPTKIFDSKEYKIDNICCGYGYALILTEEGIVYGWGDNSEGQIKYENAIFLTTPLKINKLPKIKIIALSNDSIAVSEDNLIFIWGKVIPENIVIKCEHNILNICTTKSVLVGLYILTRNGEFFYFNIVSDNKKFMKIECPDYIESIFCESSQNLVLLVTENCVYINDISIPNYKHELVRTQYKTVYDYCAEELQITYKTIDLKLQNEIETKELNIKGKLD